MDEMLRSSKAKGVQKIYNNEMMKMISSFKKNPTALASYKKDLEKFGLTDRSAYKLMTVSVEQSEASSPSSWKENFTEPELVAVNAMFSRVP